MLLSIEAYEGCEQGRELLQLLARGEKAIEGGQGNDRNYRASWHGRHDDGSTDYWTHGRGWHGSAPPARAH